MFSKQALFETKRNLKMKEILFLEYLKFHLLLFPVSYQSEADIFSLYIEVILNPVTKLVNVRFCIKTSLFYHICTETIFIGLTLRYNECQ